MAEVLATGGWLEKKADQKVKVWAVSGSKYIEAADLYDRAACCYRSANAWNKAAKVYLKLAGCRLKLDSKHEAALAYADAANNYKMISPKDAISCFHQAVDQFKGIGRSDLAAIYCREIGRI
ncbi:hypothetical protein MKX03_019370 [Papaver bracteatum]|nr:hypothetical protein MKX03_019370 [Papaver bracteatum]